MAFIEARDLRKRYDMGSGVVTDALRGVSLKIEQGEFVAIMGPSGSGKSTLLHILGFLDRPSSGTVVFDGQQMNAHTDAELARVRNEKLGFVFQAFNLLPRTSVFANVLLPLQYSSLPRREREGRVLRALDQVELTHRKDHVTSQLSGGERQRVAIARALVNAPRVIFADEPTGNLDSVTGGKILEVLDALHREGHTIILITHETPTAEYARRILRMKDGTIVSDERVEQRHMHYQK